jgi:8-oxo-dGTP pyrophosphatase MutT (NUDIX family)
VRQYRHGAGTTSLELPGGVMEPTDADPMAAALRELSEETGYVPRFMTMYSCCSPNPATHNNRVYSFIAKDLVYSGNRGCDDSEELEVVTLPISQLRELALSGQIIQGLHVAAILAACEQNGVRQILSGDPTR